MLGLHSRNHSPAVLDKIVSANAEHKSAATAQKMLRKLAEIKVSVPLIMDLTGMVGRELEEHVRQQATSHAQDQHPVRGQVVVQCRFVPAVKD